MSFSTGPWLFVSSALLSIGCAVEATDELSDPAALEEQDAFTGSPVAMNESPDSGGAFATMVSGSGGGAGAAISTGGGNFGAGGLPSSGGSATGGAGVEEGCDGLAEILPQAEFNALFPNRDVAYSWQGMVDAVEGAGDLIGFPLFAREGSCETRRQEVAAFLANVARETGQLVYIEQIDKSFQYCDSGQPYGCPAGSGQYFGRGPIQLSWNYNYRAASLALFGDERLLSSPGLVASDPAVAWATGFWFWMIGGEGGDGSRSPHAAMVDEQGFGQTIQIINGFEECNGGTVSYAQQAVSQRVCYYEKYTEALGSGLGPGSLDCNTTTDDVHCRGI